MRSFNIDDTIAAISTPIGKGGIGIVRISGPEAVKIADKIFLPRDRKNVKKFDSFTIHYGWIVDRHQTSDIRLQTSDFNTGQKKNLIHTSNQQPVINNQVIDEVLLSVMRAPRTYTKQDIVEINCHSGIVVLKQILDLVLRKGARLAEPGEFTRRAFINGRIDLAQAEAVLDMVESKTLQSAKLAVQQLEGKLSSTINDLKEKLTNIYVKLEAFIDFPEEPDTKIDFKKLKKEAMGVYRDIGHLINEAEKGQLFREGRSVVICGRPNVGKSCLMNALLRKDRVIVTPVPGTTRDTIEESISIEGIPFKVIDTAGMISSDNIVEKAGVEKSRRHLETSDLIILTLDSSEKLHPQDKELIKTVEGRPHIIVLNKDDLPPKTTIEDIEKVKKEKSLKQEKRIVSISALKGKGIEKLEEIIIDMVWEGEIQEKENILITNQRHKQSLVKANEELKRIEKLPEDESSVELMSIDIKSAIDKLGEIVGEVYTEDLLDKIFSQFCIGK